MSNREQLEDQRQEYRLHGIAFKEDILFYGSARKLEELVDLALDCIETIESTNQPRTIVIEAWLFIDFCLRETLMAGLGLNKYSLDSFDLRTELLPRSFRRCLGLLENLKQEHAGLVRDPDENLISISPKFLFYIKNNHPNVFDKLREVEEQYYKKHHSELVDRFKLDASDNPLKKERPEYTKLPKGFLKLLNQIDHEWIKNAARLNAARNLAAHSYDSSKIMKRFGCNGPHAVDHLREKCVELIESLRAHLKITRWMTFVSA